MRITLVTESFQPGGDGATTTVRAVADRLVATGHTVQVVASGPGLATYRGCPVARVRSREQVGTSLTDFAPDVALVVEPGRIGRRALDRAAQVGLPVVTLPGIAWTPGVDTLAFSPALRDAALHRTWTRGGRVAVGYAGASARRDNHVLAELSRVPGIRPVRIGGDLQTGDLAPLLASVDVFVDARPSASSGHLLRRAGASAVPAVAPRGDAASSVVRGLETGVLYDAEVPHDLARAVLGVAADSRRWLLGERAREVATERDWRVAVDELVRVHLEPRLGVPDRSAA